MSISWSSSRLSITFHWLLGDYGREARTWGHVEVLFAHNMLSMEGDALQKLKQKALTTYHLKVHSETLAKARELSTIAKIILLADEAHKNLISALKYDHFTSKESTANSIALILDSFKEMTWQCQKNCSIREHTKKEGTTVERKYLKDLLE